jgi:carbon monoxide dehydrogenase subunit G
MLNAKRELVVEQQPETVWEFVKDMGNWASQMPGYVSHEQVNDDDSVWTLNVNLGPFNRPIVMDIHVLQWTAPTEVAFELKGRFDPFHGSGTFRAKPAERGSRITLEFECEATGKMSKVLNALAVPVLKRVTDQFSVNLVNALEGRSEQSGAIPV